MISTLLYIHSGLQHYWKEQSLGVSGWALSYKVTSLADNGSPAQPIWRHLLRELRTQTKWQMNAINQLGRSPCGSPNSPDSRSASNRHTRPQDVTHLFLAICCLLPRTDNSPSNQKHFNACHLQLAYIRQCRLHPPESKLP